MQIKKIVSRSPIIDGVIWFVAMCFLTFSIAYMLICALTIEYSLKKLLMIIGVCLAIWSLCLMNKFTASLSIIFVVLSGSIYSMFLYKNDLLKDFIITLIEQIELFMKWSIRFIQGYRTPNMSYTNYLIILLCLLITLIVYFFTIKKFNFIILFVGGTIVFVFEVMQKQPISGTALFLFALTSFMYYVKSRYIALRKLLDENNDLIYKAFMKTGALAGLGIVIAAVIVANVYPYKAKFWHDFVNSFNKKEYNYMAEHFSVQSAGLQENDELLGGDIVPNNIPVLEVKAFSTTYLKAFSQSTYTGVAWKSDLTETNQLTYNNERLLDTRETLEAVKWLTGDEKAMESLFDKSSATIRFLNIRTRSLFIPPKMELFAIQSSKRKVFLAHLDTLSLQYMCGKSFTYATEFYEPKYTNETFKEALRKSKVGFYKDIKKEYPKDAARLNIWAIAAENITEKYTQLPEDLPSRIKALGETITKGKTNNYDKVKAIEEYLMTHYEYTLEPGEVDSKQDFVDQFLFEGKKGYCTYFASALAVLSRSIGVPCRYVEGYILPHARETNQEAFLVTNEYAHAWVEVYFEGIGWIICEATPPYRQSQTSSQTGLSMEEAMEKYGVSSTDGFSKISLKRVSHSNSYDLLIVLIGGMVSIIMVLSGFKTYRLKKMLPRKAVLYLFSRFIKLLHTAHLSIEGGESEKDFAIRVDELMNLNDNSFKEITGIYLMARYSQLEISSEQKQKMLDYRKKLLKACKSRLGIYKYVICKIKYSYLGSF